MAEKATAIYSYMHACMHTYIHTYMHAYIHTYIHTCMHTYIHTYIHACIHTPPMLKERGDMITAHITPTLTQRLKKQARSSPTAAFEEATQYEPQSWPCACGRCSPAAAYASVVIHFALAHSFGIHLRTSPPHVNCIELNLISLHATP